MDGPLQIVWGGMTNMTRTKRRLLAFLSGVMAMVIQIMYGVIQIIGVIQIV